MPCAFFFHPQAAPAVLSNNRQWNVPPSTFWKSFAWMGSIMTLDGGNRPQAYPTLLARKTFQWKSHTNVAEDVCPRENKSFVSTCLVPVVSVCCLKTANCWILYRIADFLADWRRLEAKTCSSEPTKSESNGWQKTFRFVKKTNKRMNQSTEWKKIKLMT